MAVELFQPQALDYRGEFGFFEDFFWYISPHLWTSLAADTNATVTVGDTHAGILALCSGDATDNNEVAVKTTNQVFRPQIGKPILLEAKLQYTEPTNNVANVAFGIANNFGAANTLLDDGGGPPTSFWGAMIYKVDGGTTWKVASSAGTLSSTGTTTATASTAGGSSYQTLRILIEPIGSSGGGTFNSSEVTFFIDGIQLCDSTYNKPIVHTIAHGAAATSEGNVGVYLKSGDAVVNAQKVYVDYLAAYSQR